MRDLLVDGIAAYRLTRLIAADTILDGPRDTVIRRAFRAANPTKAGDYTEAIRAGTLDSWQSAVIIEGRDAPKLATLVSCRWCVGLWAGIAVTVVRRRWPKQWEPIAAALTAGAAAALLARLEDD